MNDANGTATKSNEGSIRSLPAVSAHRIVAGQAVADMASAVKELVDNALDAGARSVNIRLISYGENAPGVDEIEVSDDGAGVPVLDRPLLATKHATSKLSSIDQLYGEKRRNFKTLGFRGEALFSLASISQSLCITTRCADEAVGQKLYYDHSGNMCPSLTQAVPRKVGTSVSVIKMFDTLPVRRLDLIKRSKAQRMKLLRLLQSYAILCRGIQFHVIDVVTSPPIPILPADTDSSSAQKKRKLVNKTDIKLATSNNNSTFESSVSSVLGYTMLEGMLRIPLIKGSVSLQGGKQRNQDSVAEPHSLKQNLTPSRTNETTTETDHESYTMEGLISYAPGAAPGGAVARELQLLSINDRPVEILPSLSRMINDTWKSLFPSAAGGKRPACVLALHVPPQMVDVNVSPDKREVILTHEDVIREALERTLIDLWTKQVSGVFAPHQANTSDSQDIEEILQRQIQQKTSDTRKAISLPTAVNQFSPDAKSMIRGNGVSHPPDNHFDAIRPARHLIEQTAKPTDEERAVSSVGCSLTETLVTQALNLTVSPQPLKPHNQKMPRRNAVIHDYRSMSTAQPDISMNLSPISCREDTESEKNFDDGFPGDCKGFSPINQERRDRYGHSVSPIRCHKTPQAPDDVSTARSKTRLSPVLVLSDHRGSTKNISVTEKSKYSEVEKIDSERQIKRTKRLQNETKNLVWSSFAGNDDILRQFKVTRHRMKAVNRALRQCYSNNSLSSDASHISKDVAPDKVGESVGIENEDFYSGSIQKRESHKISLSKEDFNRMTIVGQFNCGFILAICKNFHLWILDQHACDERFNFEYLVQNTVLKEQRLMKPLALELSPQEEHCIVENMSEFERNGFRFVYDNEKPPRHRLSLTAIPHSGSGGDGKKAILFGKDDVKALCSILGVEDSSDCGLQWWGGEGKYGNNAVRRYGAGQHDTLLSNTQDYKGEKITETIVAGGISGKKIARLPKAIAMFASRACRSSIMIGDALSIPQMEALVRKMQHVDNPWDCAHGRPTIRHVKDLLNVLYEEETTSYQHVASSCLGLLSQVDKLD